MGDAPYTGDLDLAGISTRDQLAEALRVVHVRADAPSLRILEARTRHGETPLSKTAVGEMLKGARFPRKAVMVAFLRVCGISDDAMEPWRRAWDQVAVGTKAATRPESGTQAGSSAIGSRADEADPQRSDTRQSADRTNFIEALDRSSANGARAEIADLKKQLGELTAQNESLRQKLEDKADVPSAQIAMGSDKATGFQSGQQRHAVQY